MSGATARGLSVDQVVCEIGSGMNGHRRKLTRLLSDPAVSVLVVEHRDRKQIQLRMGQANVRRWVDDILPLLVDSDPLGVEHFATHRLPLAQAPEAYANFQEKKDGTVKVLLRP